MTNLPPAFLSSFLQVALLSFIAAPLGVFLLLRRMSLVGDAIAHAILPGSAIAYLLFGFSFTAMMVGGMLTGLIVALLSYLVSRYTHITEDASLASFYIISLCLGVIIMAGKGAGNDELLHILFGSMETIKPFGLWFLFLVSAIGLLVLAIIYRPLVILSFDRSFLMAAAANGARLRWLVEGTFMVLLVMVMVACFFVIGTLLAVGMMILPAITARYWSRQIDALVAVALLMALLAGFVGLVVGYRFHLPLGPSVVMSNGVLYLLSVMFGRRGSLLSNWKHRRHLVE